MDTGTNSSESWQPDTGRHTHDPFREALDNASDAIGISTPQGVHYYQNNAFTDLFGDVGADPASTVYCDPEVGREVFRTIMAGSPWTGEVVMYGRDRRVLNVLLRAYAAKDSEGRVTSLVGIHTDITDRKRAEGAIRDNEEQLKALSDNLPGGLVYQVDTGPDGRQRRFTYISDGVQELHELSAEAVLGDATLVYSQLDEVDRRRVAERETEALKLLVPFNIEACVTLPSGKRRWRLFTSAPRRLSDGRLIWDGVELDITDHKAVEERCRATVEASPVGMHFYRLDPDDRLVFVGANPAADRLLGVDNFQFVGKTIEDAFPPLAGTEIPNRYRRVALSGERWETEEVAYEHGRVKGVYSVIAYQIEPRHMVAMFFDITDRRRGEEAQKRVAALESLGSVAGGIAHDFNNILTGVFGNIELAQLELPMDHPSAASLRAAQQAIDSARRLSSRLLTFAKGGTPLLEAVDLRQGICDAVRFHLAGSNVATHFDIAPDLWPVKADKGQIGEVISNLTLNAKEAMPSGGTLHVQACNQPAGQQVPSLAPLGDCVRLIFRDEGVGIPATIIDRIFDPYFTTKQTGTGLGLAIVHGIVKRHQGHIEVDSAPSAGTTFTILLPADTSGAAGAESRDDSIPTTLPSASGHILLMDDNEVVLKATSSMLTRLGHTVETAADGKEAIAKFGAAIRSGKPFDVTIMDLTVPGGTGGKEALGEIRSLDPGARVLVASGYSSDPVLADFGEHGFSGRLAKPFGLRDLDEAIRQVLKKPSLP